MTQEQKDLLLKDLCRRLPYGVKVNAPFTSNKNENAKGYKINGINFGVVEWTPVLFGEKKQRNSIIIEAFSEKYNQYCSIDIELNNNIERVKPYLFPLSSMSEEQRKEFLEISHLENRSFYNGEEIEIVSNEVWAFDLGGDADTEYRSIDIKRIRETIKWLDKNHFDWGGLIPMGLAEDATNKNIY